MVEYKILFSKDSKKDAKKLSKAGLAKKAQDLIAILKTNPFQSPPPFEKLIGNLKGTFSRRINIRHRLVYEVNEDEKKVRILRMWSHYGD